MTNTLPSTKPLTPPRRSWGRKLFYAALSLAIGMMIAAILCEGIFSVMECRTNRNDSYVGRGGIWFSEGRWGWKPTIGDFKSTTKEFSITGTINSLYMNDMPFVPGADDARTRILALGDSHTYAIGVSTHQTWPKILERKLNDDGHGGNRQAFRVYNGGCVAFNMHQYLLRLIDQGPTLKPHYVVLGLSYVNDLYDLLPPDRGGWVAGGNDKPRDYFDFDPAGQLVERHWVPVHGQAVQLYKPAARVRAVLEHFATFRYLRRSKLALMIGSRVKVNGSSMWPNMEVLIEKEISDVHRYQWKLFEALLDRIKQECVRQNAKLIVVGIPYLPQVYDEIWQATFGGDSRFSCTVGIERVKAMCNARNIVYVETLDDLRSKSRELDHWLHYHADAHCTPEGHEVIAETIFKSNVLKPRAVTTAP